MKFKMLVMGLLTICLFIVTACEDSEPKISQEEAKAIVVDHNSGDKEDIKIISVSHKLGKYIVKWENEGNCESG
ncbi:hypothetical protein ACFO3D_18770 [Virgibacillus kekensis]|uniref:Lipoprotein n=1 Tax=Virgibacillus kekensis TaxID=202261 RepID=A0ABV9DRJ4_9BACI